MSGNVIHLPRPRSNDVAQVAAFPVGDEVLAKSLQGKQREMSRYRQTVAHFLENDKESSVAAAPQKRQARKGADSSREDKRCAFWSRDDDKRRCKAA
jgi:hypothetical protein